LTEQAINAASNGTRLGPWQQLRRFLLTLLAPQVSSAARERRDTLVLLLALAFVVLPHLQHTAWWASMVLAVLWTWRFWLALTQRPLPPRLAMLPLLAAATLAVWAEHRTLLGRDAGVTFLLMLLALKLLEMRARRDVFVVIFLAFFILLTQFLFGQGIVVALLSLGAVLLLFFSLISVNLAENDLSAAHKARLVGVVLLKALPLAAALFLLFPRLPGPLWGIASDASTSRTGLSSTMTPGAIGQLLQSEAIAFRVRFAGEQPPMADQLYWRGPVLGLFTGRSWLALAEADRPDAVPTEVRSDAQSVIEYTVTLEPHRRDWLFALEWPTELPATGRVGDGSSRLSRDGQLLANGLVAERMRYTLRSATRFSLGMNETPLSLRAWTQLPSGFNPRTLEYAAQLRQQVPGALISRDADAALVGAVLTRFRREGYRYTLEPPVLGRHTVDEFLFETKAGFCEHYASAFVTLMRALDVPARVVTGYQGGEYNPIDDYLTVRQADAHAWAEVWLAGRGWVRVDPTAAVAPERIERTRGRPDRERAGAGAGAVAPAVFDLWRALRLNAEAIENAWNQWVLSYSPERQRALLRALGLAPDMRTLIVLFAVAISFLLAVLAWFSLRHRVPRDPLGEIVVLLKERLLRAGIAPPSHLGLRGMLPALKLQLDPASYATACELLARIETLRYARAGQRAGPAQWRELKRAVRRFRPSAA
jgi:transglutaminase-like putative cysteine protease